MARNTLGTLYVGHLDRPMGARRVQHYCGWAGREDVSARWAEHLSGQGAALIRGAVRAGIAVRLYVIGPGTPGDERTIKRRKANLAGLCPECTGGAS